MGVVAATAMSFSLVFAQGHTLVIQSGATFSGTGTITVKDSIQNAGISSQTLIAGKVAMTGATSVIGTASNGPIKVNTLSIRGSGTTNIPVNMTVTDSLNILSGATLNIAGTSDTLNGLTGNSGTYAANTSGSTTIYNASGAQNVMAGNYYNLTIQNSGTKSAQGAVTVLNGGSLNVANSTIFDLGANALTLQMTSTSAVTNNGTIQTSATGTAVSTAAQYQIGGTFIYYASSGSQTVGSANYNNLTYQNAGTRAITGTVGIAGTFTVAGTRTYTGSTVNYNGSASFGSLSQNIIGGEAYNNLGISGGAAQADTATHKVVTTGALTLNSGSGVLTLGANTTLDMSGYTGSWINTSTMQSSSQIMWQGSNAYLGGGGLTQFYGSATGNVAAGTNYGNMFFGGTGMMTFIGATTVTGNLTVNSSAQVTVNGSITVQINGSLNAAGNITNNGNVTLGN